MKNLNRLNMRLMLLSIILGCSVFRVAAQQEPMYSQYMFNMVQINPAYAGNRATDNITNMYRRQWVGIPGSPSTASLSWDRRQPETNVGYGLQVYTDHLGIENTTGIQGFYSYRLPFQNSSLTFGLSGGVMYFRAAYSEANTLQGGDPAFMEDEKAILPTAGIGALYATEKFYLGLSCPALFRTKVAWNQSLRLTDASKHYFLTGGYVFDVSSVVKLKPSILVKSVSGAPLEYDFNMNVWLNEIVGLGASYRTGDAIVGMFELQISPEFRLGYAYDYTISNLKPFNKGTHELMLRYEFGAKKGSRILSPRYY